MLGWTRRASGQIPGTIGKCFPHGIFCRGAPQSGRTISSKGLRQTQGGPGRRARAPEKISIDSLRIAQTVFWKGWNSPESFETVRPALSPDPKYLGSRQDL